VIPLTVNKIASSGFFVPLKTSFPLKLSTLLSRYTVLSRLYTKVALINMLISYAQSSPPHLPQNLNSNKSFQANQKIQSMHIFASYFRTHLRRGVNGADCKPCTLKSFNLIAFLMAFLINAIFNVDLLAPPNSSLDYSSNKYICTQEIDAEVASSLDVS